MADDWEDDVPMASNNNPVAVDSGVQKDEWNDWAAPTTTQNNGGWGNDDTGSKGRGRGKCFKCNEEGHMSRECPTGGGGNGGGSRKCFNCNEEGHQSRDCPEPRKPREGGRTCNNCQKEGHMARECTEPRKVTCRNCNKDGHMQRDCPEKSSGGPRKCYNCNEEGHQSRECPQPRQSRNDGFSKSNGGGGTTDSFSWDTTDKAETKADGGWESWDAGDGTNGGGGDNNAAKSGGGSGCRKCGKEGHFARECPEGGGGGGGSGCRRCGKDGHFAKDCTEEAVGPDGKPRPPLYTPEDIKEDDETIYHGITTGINFDRYDSIPVNVTGKEVPAPMTAFGDKIQSETLLSAIEKCHYTKPTPVQKYGIPIILAKRDLMACAQTGSGKTAAFLLPIIQDLLQDKELPDLYGKSEQTPLCVIITPTRELAIQIYTEAFKFAKGSIVRPQILYGGTAVGAQAAKLSSGTHLLVATPGRLLDFVDKGRVSFARLKYLILDEADRMIDQGFIPEIRRMVSHSSMPAKGVRQTLMFSATFAAEVQRLASEFLSEEYLFLTVGMVGAANADVEQVLLKVEKFEKRTKLQEILTDSNSNERTMIFVEQKKTADFLASFLSQCNYKATSIHGDRFQRQREEALYDFKTGKMPILVATSVAARGLDIKDVRHVINYDLPKDVDDYVHRIGRTGRVGNVGKATSFYDPSSDRELAKSLAKILGDAKQVVPEWLTEDIGTPGFSGSANRSNFGGTDIRRNANHGGDNWDSATPMDTTPSAAPSGDADESWD